MMNHTVRRALSLLLAFALIVSLFSAFPARAQDTQVKTRTILLYIIGTNLESGGGFGTQNLMQALCAPYDENTNFLVLTGETDMWHMESAYLDGADEIRNDILQIWKLEGRREDEAYGRMILLDTPQARAFENVSMNDPATLTAFIDFGCDFYPAEAYDLILWDHGGGPAYGYAGFPIDGLVEAFGNSGLSGRGEKLELLDFDACAMCSAEIAAALCPYIRFLVASAESEPARGQEYTGWLTAVQQDPGMSGRALSRAIVDSTADYYDKYFPSWNVTFSAVDLELFEEKMLDDLVLLSDLMIREIKTPGARNGRFNFYDELYALENSIAYADGEGSLYDLGNLLGALSVPQSESDNITEAQAAALENEYTAVALRLLDALRSEDLLYCRSSDVFMCGASLGCARDMNGQVIWPDDSGFFPVYPSGMSFFFGSDNYMTVRYLCPAMRETARLLPADSASGVFLRNQTKAAAYYCLIYRAGYILSMVEDRGYRDLTPSDLKDWILRCWQGDVYAYFLNYLYLAGEFPDAQDTDEAWEYLYPIFRQQLDEVVTKEKISVKKILEADGSSSFYQATVTGASAQTFMELGSALSIHPACEQSEDYRQFTQWLYGDDYSSWFPDGVEILLGESKGELKIADYYDDLSDSDALIRQRIYASETSTWIVPAIDDTLFVLYDSTGKAHLAYPDYLDSTGETASILLILWDPQEEDRSLLYTDCHLNIFKNNGVWQIDGLSMEGEDGIERSHYPMDSERFAGCLFAPAAVFEGPANGYYGMLPLSDFTAVETALENWGIRFGYEHASSLADVTQIRFAAYAEDVYHYRTDVTDRFLLADETAENGDVAYRLDGAELRIEDPVYDGQAQRPDVSVTLNGRELVPGTDFKVIYDGSTDPGDAYVAVMGIGDYVGTVFGHYMILPADHQHQWSEWVQTKAPTWEENGEETRVCAICGEKETRPVARLMPDPYLPPYPAEPYAQPAPVVPEKPAFPFEDVNEGDPFYDDIAYVYESGIMYGMSETQFGQGAVLTRAMLVTILYRLQGEPSVSGKHVYDDVDPGAWYASGVEWAASAGIVSGYGGGLYGPDDPVTREQLAAILYRYARFAGFAADAPALFAADAGKVSEYAVEAVGWAAGYGILTFDEDGAIRPGVPATRAEIAHAIRTFLTVLSSTAAAA